MKRLIASHLKARQKAKRVIGLQPTESNTMHHAKKCVNGANCTGNTYQLFMRMRGIEYKMIDIKRFRIEFGVNDYATFSYTDENSEEVKATRKQLISERYNFSKAYPKPIESEDEVGKNIIEELWFK